MYYDVQTEKKKYEDMLPLAQSSSIVSASKLIHVLSCQKPRNVLWDSHTFYRQSLWIVATSDGKAAAPVSVSEQ